jgi:hypothetical protein
METSVSILLVHSWNVSVLLGGFIAALTHLSGLKKTINREGTWRIRKKEKSPVIEVYQVEEQGHGDILSPAFKAWRSTMASASS